eukprot:6034542-Amphidinium_carterae.1
MASKALWWGPFRRSYVEAEADVILRYEPSDQGAQRPLKPPQSDLGLCLREAGRQQFSTTFKT